MKVEEKRDKGLNGRLLMTCPLDKYRSLPLVNQYFLCEITEVYLTVLYLLSSNYIERYFSFKFRRN